MPQVRIQPDACKLCINFTYQCYEEGPDLLMGTALDSMVYKGFSFYFWLKRKWLPIIWE